MEPHKKGLERLRDRTSGGRTAAPDSAWDIPLHIHFVTRSDFKMPINLMRKCWLAALGRDGNIDVQWLKVKNDSDAAIDRVASYATKYITKGLAEFERFNKKRYWSAGAPLLPKLRSWMRARNISDAFKEMRERLGIADAELGELISSRRLFLFPDGSGVWVNYRPSSGLSPPPPF